MYAVIATGGKQYRVEKDAVLRVEKLDAEPGATVEFGEVLLIGDGDNDQGRHAAAQGRQGHRPRSSRTARATRCRS